MTGGAIRHREVPHRGPCLALKPSSLDGRPGERRFKVSGKGRKERFMPIEASLEALIDTYLTSRQTRFPDQPTGASASSWDRVGVRSSSTRTNGVWP